MGSICGNCQSQNESFAQLGQVPQKLVEEKLHSCMIRISYGDLLQENTDAIVAVVNPSMSFTGRLCKQILREGGKQLQNEIQKLQSSKRSFENGQVFYTHSGELDYDFIFFAVLPPVWNSPDRRRTQIYEENSIEAATAQFSSHKDQRQFVFQGITEVLKLSEDLQLNSVSFPFICAETSSHMTATIMLVAIKAFIEEQHHKLQHLNLDQLLVPVFRSAFEKIIQGVNDIDPPPSHVTPVLRASQEYDGKKQSFLEQNHNDQISQGPDNDFMRFGHPCSDNPKFKRKDSI